MTSPTGCPAGADSSISIPPMDITRWPVETVSVRFDYVIRRGIVDARVKGDQPLVARKGEYEFGLSLRNEELACQVGSRRSQGGEVGTKRFLFRPLLSGDEHPRRRRADCIIALL